MSEPMRLASKFVGWLYGVTGSLCGSLADWDRTLSKRVRPCPDCGEGMPRWCWCDQVTEEDEMTRAADDSYRDGLRDGYDEARRDFEPSSSVTGWRGFDA